MFNAGIVPGISLIVPSPGQTDEELENTYSSLKNVCENRLASVLVTIPCLFPRTLWWEDRERYGINLFVSEDEYRKFLALYKIKHILPPAYWQEAPYSIDGKNFSEYSKENALFQARLANEGFLINTPDEIILLAKLLDLPVESIRGIHRKMMITLNVDELSKFVKDCNNKMSQICQGR